MSFKDKNHHKRKINNSKKDLVENVKIYEETLEGEISKDNNEISINYVMTEKR